VSARDPTITERVRRFERKRRSTGWVKVSVWVPNEADAAKLREQARDMRELYRVQPGND